MTSLYMTLSRRVFRRDEALHLPCDHCGLWVAQGLLSVGENPIGPGDGIYAERAARITANTDTELLEFAVGDAPVEGALLSHALDWPDTDAILRLDQVSFPPGAGAYRHVHPGPGIRCLTDGTLEIRSDHDRHIMTALDAWFEAANSPVQATAGDRPTAFVRAMILPLEYEGKPTLRLLDPGDEGKPRLQTNRRFFDQRIRLRRD